ncbi:MAG: methionyl-tRNA formyltransferase [Desulfobacterales bacterium]|nr:MAG: methionyl-tRNA formyltransferase [Desulfobacterales bacterium]
MTKKAKIIFMGTPEFAVPALKALHENDQNIALVVTQPDRPKGRGRKVAPTPVKLTATHLDYDVIQPTSIRTFEFSNHLAQYEPDMVVVVAYGRIIPKDILSLPKLATINVHASLLPKYRGPAPIHWAIINGEKETGITTMLMDEGLDTGDILQSLTVEIDPEDTSGTLYSRLAERGAGLLIQTLRSFEDGDIKPIPQDHSRASYAPLLKKNDGHITWNMPAKNLLDFIRGMSPWPGAFTFHGKRRLKIFKAKPVQMDASGAPGTVLEGFPDELVVATGQDALSILEIQGASGKRLLVKDFLRGSNIHPGTTLR